MRNGSESSKSFQVNGLENLFLVLYLWLKINGIHQSRRDMIDKNNYRNQKKIETL